MKIATFNINNINKRLENLIAWLTKTEPDVVCLQELKAEQRSFPARTLRALGYKAVWEGERSWNGVAILAREHDPVLTRSSLPGNPEDRQARYIEAAVNGIVIASIYLPNGNPQPGPKFNYKLAWFERLITHAAELLTADVPVVLAGDYNVVPTVEDIYSTRSLDDNALVQPESRQAFARMVTQGWTDALRRLHPDGPLWTFWDYKRERWPANKGMRLDHFLLSPGMVERLADGGVDRWVRGEVNASDHAPAWIVLDYDDRSVSPLPEPLASSLWEVAGESVACHDSPVVRQTGRLELLHPLLRAPCETVLSLAACELSIRSLFERSCFDHRADIL